MNIWSWLDVFGCFATLVVILGFSAANWNAKDNLVNVIAFALSLTAVFITGTAHVIAWITCLLLLGTNFISNQFLEQLQKDPSGVAQIVGITITAVSGAAFIFSRNTSTSIIFCLSMVAAICFILYGLPPSKNRTP